MSSEKGTQLAWRQNDGFSLMRVVEGADIVNQSFRLPSLVLSSRACGGKHSFMQNAAAFLEKNFQEYLEDLKGLARIPSVSFDGFPASEVRRSAQAVAELLKKRGLENVQILEVPGAHPYVYGERLKAPGKPTLLLYAHHDVQPPGREELWKTPPFEPTLKPGPGGERLYGRGTADDKAGVVIHTSAIEAYLKTVGELPVNVKVVIEGEEEIGSSHLPEFLKTYRSKLDADVLVLTDTTNFDCGVPALTVALRGLVGMEIEVRALSKTVHSGMWGGPVPDPAMALSKMLATLVDSQGHIAVPGVMDGVPAVTEAEISEFKKVPYVEKDFRAQAGMVDGARMIGPDLPKGSEKHAHGVSPMIQVWRLPSLTVNAVQASSRKQAGNIINDVAWAKITIRVVDGMDPKKTYELLEKHLRAQVPWGLEAGFKVEGCNGAWSTNPTGPAFEAANAALTKGYGREPLKIGCGGSIPFVQPFADALGGAPALLVGVEDPYTNAHGENESLLVSDLRKACLGQIYLFGELAERWRKA
jgi:acetylornithine deacetylase/succinyl-diaminopimelate desuccinylase-like protein